MKSYTDLDQSKKLAEFLPLESADGVLCEYDDGSWHYEEWVDKPATSRHEQICWSLAALLEQLPYEVCDDDGNSSYLQMNKEDDVYQLVYTDPYENFESIETDRYEHFVYACYEMIMKLHELNLL